MPPTQPLSTREDVNNFLKRYEDHQAELAAEPTREEKFATEQFQAVIKAVNDSNAALLKFLKKNDLSVSGFPTKIGTPDSAKVAAAVKGLEKSLKPPKQDLSPIVKELKSLRAGLDSLPANMPSVDKVVVSNLDALSQRLDTVISAIKAQDLKPVIKVEKPDLSPILKAIEANKPTPIDLKPVIDAQNSVKKTLLELKFPVSNTPTDPLIKYTPADIDDAAGSTGVNYFGYTDTSGAWYIRKFDQSSSPKSIRFAFGQSAYATNWGNRASLTYAIWGS